MLRCDELHALDRNMQVVPWTPTARQALSRHICVPLNALEARVKQHVGLLLVVEKCKTNCRTSHVLVRGSVQAT